MTLQAKRLPIEHAKSASERRILFSIEARLRDIERHLSAILETDPRRGIARVKAPVLPSDLEADPTLVSTFGRTGEVRTLRGVPYVKQGATATDTNWRQLDPQPGSTFALAYYSATAPIGLPEQLAFWIKPLAPAEGHELHYYAPDKFGAWDWRGPQWKLR